MKFLSALILLLFCFQVTAQDIVGHWETYDDKTDEKKAIIEIYKERDTYFGKIIEKFTGPENATCEKCEGSKKNTPIIGLVIIENIKKEGDSFEGGTILDPESGDTYKCYLKLVNANKLKVRGYLGVSLFGRTQYWRRKKII
jgi:uncharacterized protein (DUF2147 family)